MVDPSDNQRIPCAENAKTPFPRAWLKDVAFKGNTAIPVRIDWNPPCNCTFLLKKSTSVTPTTTLFFIYFTKAGSPPWQTVNRPTNLAGQFDSSHRFIGDWVDPLQPENKESFRFTRYRPVWASQSLATGRFVILYYCTFFVLDIIVHMALSMISRARSLRRIFFFHRYSPSLQL